MSKNIVLKIKKMIDKLLCGVISRRKMLIQDKEATKQKLDAIYQQLLSSKGYVHSFEKLVNELSELKNYQSQIKCSDKPILPMADIKIFCISLQKNGTTSVGKFFKYFKYDVADWSISNRNKWTYYHYNGDFEKIFSSSDFINSQVFEDDPWFLPEFYKQLFFRFDNSKFILFKRDPDKWFNSMMLHSGGKSLGDTLIHAKVYRRENEVFNLYNSTASEYMGHKNGLDLISHKQHYIDIYNRHNFEVEQFFRKHAPDRLMVCDLTDEDKWKKLGNFCGISVPDNFEIWANKSK